MCPSPQEKKVSSIFVSCLRIIIIQKPPFQSCYQYLHCDCLVKWAFTHHLKLQMTGAHFHVISQTLTWCLLAS